MGQDPHTMKVCRWETCRKKHRTREKGERDTKHRGRYSLMDKTPFKNTLKELQKIMTNVCVCMCVFLDAITIEYQHIYFTRKVRTILQSAASVAGPHNFKGLFKSRY